jgi:AraC-like DNA-binding protein
VKYFVNFAGQTAHELMRDCGLAPGSILTVDGIADVRAAFDALIWQGLRHDRRTDAICALQLQLLLHTLDRSRRRPGATATQRRARATFERVAELIDHDFLKLNSVDALARACHLDASHLSRLTRRFGQDSPLRLLQRRKMQWAAERLENSAQLVRQVADELGMDAFQFSRTFKRIHGLSPSAFLAARA